MGGADQWGNITAGCELIRRKAAGDAFALTCPLITKADGTKFGKSAAGEKIWLDPSMTSPYKFYQFWLNVSDDEALRYIKIFTLLSHEEIEAIRRRHLAAPHDRPLQKELAREITVRVHSEEQYRMAVQASGILFGEGTPEALKAFSESDLLIVFEEVPRFVVAKSEVEAGIPIVDFLSVKTSVFPSKGEARRMLQGGGVFINKEKVGDPGYSITPEALLRNRYIVVQKGKKNYYLVKVE
jgi:tyrosyl-tRNA synthetase